MPVSPQSVCIWERELLTFQKSRRSPVWPRIQCHALQRCQHTHTLCCCYKHLWCSSTAKQHYFPYWAACMFVLDLQLCDFASYLPALSVSNLFSLHFSRFLFLTQSFNVSFDLPLSIALIWAAIQSVLQAQCSAHTPIKTRPHTLAAREDKVSLWRRSALCVSPWKTTSMYAA